MNFFERIRTARGRGQTAVLFVRMSHPYFSEHAGGRLQSERLRLRLTAEDVAKATGRTKATVYAYESERTSPTLDYLGLLPALGFDMDFVLRGVRGSNLTTLDDVLVLQPSILVVSALAARSCAASASELRNQRRPMIHAAQAISRVPTHERALIDWRPVIAEVDSMMAPPLSAC